MRKPLYCLAIILFALNGCPSTPPEASLIQPDAPGDATTNSDTPNSPSETNKLINIGHSEPLPCTVKIGAHDLVAFPISIATEQAGELVGWGVSTATGPTATQVRLALFTNTATNQPNMLVAQSNISDLGAGLLPTSGIQLEAGSYWMLLSVNNTISIGQGTASPVESRECYRGLEFTAPFPSPWNSGSCFSANPINVFIQIRTSK